MDAVVIRDAIGDYRVGDIVSGKEMTKFLKTKPNADSYHKITLPDTESAPDPELPLADKENA